MKWIFLVVTVSILITACNTQKITVQVPGNEDNQTVSEETHSKETKEETSILEVVESEVPTETDNAEPRGAGRKTSFTPDEIEEVRKSLTYQRAEYGPTHSIIWENCDEQTRKLHEFIVDSIKFGIPVESFTSVTDESAQRFLIRSAFFNTKSVFYELDDLNHNMRDYIMSAMNTEGRISPKEHVEETARQLFGENVLLDHTVYGGTDEVLLWYDDTFGFYASEAFMLMEHREPVFLLIQEHEDSYELEVALPYVEVEARGYYDGDTLGEPHRITCDDYAALVEYCASKMERHKITLLKGKDDSLQYGSHILPSQ